MGESGPGRAQPERPPRRHLCLRGACAAAASPASSQTVDAASLQAIPYPSDFCFSRRMTSFTRTWS
eukprot:3954689-Pleurochrysis_carterae.AAC.2